MAVAITGASGELAGRTLRELMAREDRPEHVVALTRSPDSIEEWSGAGVDVRRADYTEPQTLLRGFGDVDRLLLVPTMDMPRDRIPMLENVLDAAREQGVRHVVDYGFLATDLACPFVMTPYYLYAESALRVSGLEWTVLRNGPYADPVLDWVDDILEMGEIPYPSGEGRAPFVARDDIARAAAAVLATEGHEGRIYDLTGPEALTTADLAAIVSRVTGREVVDPRASEEDYVRLCIEDGIPEPFAHLLASMYRAIREGFFDKVSRDIERLTGTPPLDLEELLRRRWEQ